MLSTANAAVKIPKPGVIEATATTDEERQRIFGAVLSALPPRPTSYVLYFLLDSDELAPESRTVVAQVLGEITSRPAPEVLVIGHTDTMGTQQANYALGLKRAMTVRNILVEAGLDGSTIDVTSVGELDLLVKTADETPEPRNRRVDIAVR